MVVGRHHHSGLGHGTIWTITSLASSDLLSQRFWYHSEIYGVISLAAIVASGVGSLVLANNCWPLWQAKSHCLAHVDLFDFSSWHGLRSECLGLCKPIYSRCFFDYGDVGRRQCRHQGYHSKDRPRHRLWLYPVRLDLGCLYDPGSSRSLLSPSGPGGVRSTGSVWLSLCSSLSWYTFSIAIYLQGYAAG